MRLKFHIEDARIRPFLDLPNLFIIILNGETYRHCSSRHIAGYLRGIFANAQEEN